MQAADPNQWEFDINTSHNIKNFVTDLCQKLQRHFPHQLCAKGQTALNLLCLQQHNHAALHALEGLHEDEEENIDGH